MLETLETGREAFRRHAWSESQRAFTEAAQASQLSAEDLKLWAEALWWDGRPDEAIEAWERAFAGYLEVGQRTSAAMVALELAYLAFRRMAFAIGGGWMSQAAGLLQAEPESGVHGWLEVLHTAESIFGRGDLAQAIVHADRAIELGDRHGSRDVQAISRSIKGMALIYRGEWQEGLKLIDEATAAAMSGELDLRAASDIYCNTIAACRNLADYRRAGEWTEEADRWMRRQAIGGYPGICRVHRAELKRLRGLWPEAEREARHACDELQRFRILDAIGFAQYEVGEVRLRMGDLEAAEEAFNQAYEYGTDPQPGLALLHFARGEIEEAASSIARSLSEVDVLLGDQHNFLGRVRLLPAQVEIALARGDLETARSAAEELEDVAGRYESLAIQAAALTCRGAVLLQEGTPEEAAALLGKGWRLWQQIELPYEAALARVILGSAHAAAGDLAASRRDLQAARAAFESLGATLDVRRVDELLGDEAAPRSGRGHRVRKTFMFTDIVTSTDLVAVIGDDAWKEVLRWHDRELRSAFARHGGEEVKHTGDGFFVAFEDARAAVECAVAIQRGLAEHRRQHGFAPWVRIGLHTAEATREASDYSGAGVHVAARVGAVGGQEEIVVSAATLAEAGVIPFPLSEARAVRLKGISESVEVANVDWRA